MYGKARMEEYAQLMNIWKKRSSGSGGGKRDDYGSRIREGNDDCRNDGNRLVFDPRI